MIKDWIAPVIMTILFASSIFALIYVVGEGVSYVREESINNTNNICDSIGLDVLSVSKQVFGDDYVICYDKTTNETRRILI